MTSLNDVSSAIYGVIKAIGEAVWEFDSNGGILEEARKLHRLLRRIEVLITDIEACLQGVRIWSSLREIECTLSALLQAVSHLGAKGPLVQYLQADRILALFASTAANLDAELSKLQVAATGMPDIRCEDSSKVAGHRTASASIGLGQILARETQEELTCLRESLQRTRFELPASHQANLKRFRQACDHVRHDVFELMESYGGMMDDILQTRQLSKEAFHAVVGELQREVELQTEYQQAGRSTSCEGFPGACWSAQEHGHSHCHGHHGQQRLDSIRRGESEQHYVQMLMDVVRAAHHNTDCEAPLDFICPLTHQLMQDPVILHETGHSYERKALEEWWATGHRFCPRSGVHLRRLNTTPNHNLRAAIERWRLHGDLHLSFRPILDTLISGPHQHQQVLLCRTSQGRDRDVTVKRQAGGQEPRSLHGSVSVDLCLDQAAGVLAEVQAEGLTLSQSLQRLAIQQGKARSFGQASVSSSSLCGRGSESALADAEAIEVLAACAGVDSLEASGSTGRSSPTVSTPQRVTSQELLEPAAVGELSCGRLAWLQENVVTGSTGSGL